MSNDRRFDAQTFDAVCADPHAAYDALADVSHDVPRDRGCDCWDGYFACIRRFFDVNGRSSAEEIGGFLVANLLMLCLLTGVFFAVLSLSYPYELTPILCGVVRLSLFLGLILLASAPIPCFCAIVRRLHDQDCPGQLILLGLIPIYGPLVLFDLCRNKPSFGVNTFGPRPKEYLPVPLDCDLFSYAQTPRSGASEDADRPRAASSGFQEAFPEDPGFASAFFACLYKYGKLEGRASVSEFFGFFFVWSLLGFFLRFAAFQGAGETAMEYAAWFYWAFTICPLIAAAIRRLHDANASGFYALFALIPVVGVFIVLGFLLLRSTPGANDYGPRPLKKSELFSLLERQDDRGKFPYGRNAS